MAGDAAPWDAKAEEWLRWIGDEGDATRRYLTDPVLWRMLGEVRGKKVLDAGCGTGYLTLKLAARGASAVGVDVSPKMIELARRRMQAKGVRLDLRVDDCATLATVADASFDLVVSNLVLMDVSDLDGAARSLARVLRPGGRAACAFLHPCFESPPARYGDDQTTLQEWGPFATPFVHHHRPLSRYLNAFVAAGLSLRQMEEPVIGDPPPPEFHPERAARWRDRPFTVVFLLEKDRP